MVFQTIYFNFKLLTGAPVDRSTSTQKSKGFFPYCLAFYGAILLLANALINIKYLYGYISNNFLLNQTDTLSSQQFDNNPQFQFQPENNKTKTQSDYISMGIDMANEVFMVFGSHLCFFLVRYVRSPSKRLWDCFFEIEKHLRLSDQCYHRVRKIVFFGLGLLFSVIQSIIN